MPTYEYQCDSCQHRFEEMQSFKDDPLKTCPACKLDKLRRLFGTGAAILFKGSGFYETDYRSESYKKAAKAEQEASSSKPSGDTGSTSNGSTNGAAKETSKSESKPTTSTT